MGVSTRDVPDWAWCAVLIASLCVILLINPLGYIGGGWDDWQYLTAARCWVEHGPCLPRTHWEGRWPVFAPIAAITAMFGESRLTVGIWPLISSVACLFVIALVGNRLLGRPIGWVAALLFAATPAFSIQLLDPSVEALELAFILGGVLCISCWLDQRSPLWAFCAGVCFAMAFQVRETALIATALAGLFVSTRKPRAADLALAACGFVLPMAIEMAIYWTVTGDPLLRRRLSMAHTQIPSSELLGPVDAGHSPFFNKAYIANWRHEPGVHVHWSIDGLLNLLINGKAGLSLLLTPVLAFVFRRRLDASDRTAIWKLYCLAIGYASILTYAFAIDPKARMMFVPLSAATLALGLVLARLVALGERVPALVAAASQLFVGMSILFVHQRTDILEKPTAQWIARFPGGIEIDPNTRRHLALVPSAESLPGLESNRPYLLYNSVVRCRDWLRRAGLPNGSVVTIADQPISSISLLVPSATGSLCLFRYQKELKPEEIRNAIRRSRIDGPYVLDPRTYLGTRQTGFGVPKRRVLGVAGDIHA